MAEKLKDYEVTDFLKNKREVGEYLDYLAETEKDPALFIAVVNDLARKKGMSKVAKRNRLVP